MSHLRLEHRLGHRQETFVCPLCLTALSPGQDPFFHVAEHLEDISLAVLLQHFDSAGNSPNSAYQSPHTTSIFQAVSDNPEKMAFKSLERPKLDWSNLEKIAICPKGSRRPKPLSTRISSPQLTPYEAGSSSRFSNSGATPLTDVSSVQGDTPYINPSSTVSGS